MSRLVSAQISQNELPRFVSRVSLHRAYHVPEVALLLSLPVLHLPEVVLLLGEPVLAVALLNGGGDTVILGRRLFVC